MSFVFLFICFLLIAGCMFQITFHLKFKKWGEVYSGTEEKQWQSWYQCCCEFPLIY